MEEGLDDDIELVGTKADASLNAMPHARCHCPKHNFKQVKADAEVQAGTREQNCKTCDKCYCYVCDTLASECASWQDHCMAYDRDPVWRQRRQEKKHPEAAKAAAASGGGGAAAAAASGGGIRPQAAAAAVSGGAAAAAAVPVAALAGRQPPRPPPVGNGWTTEWSAEHSMWFYWHEATKKTQWERPARPAGARKRAVGRGRR